jgi:hypothetical protein
MTPRLSPVLSDPTSTAETRRVPASTHRWMAARALAWHGPGDPGRQPGRDRADHGIRRWTGQDYKQSKTSWAEPTSKSAPTPRSAATDPGQLRVQLLPGRLVPRPPHTPPACGTATARPRREDPHADLPPPAPPWPQALRAIPAWLPLDHAAELLAGTAEDAPPPQLQALINSLAAGHGLHLSSRSAREPCWRRQADGRRRGRRAADGSRPAPARRGHGPASQGGLAWVRRP